MFLFRTALLVFLGLGLFFLGLLYRSNPSAVTVSDPFGGAYSTPIWLLVLVVLTILGAMVMYVGYDGFLFVQSLLAGHKQAKLQRGRNLIQEAEELLATGYMNLALRRVQQAIECAPEDSRGHILLGNIYRRQGRINDAVLAHEKGMDYATDQTHLLIAQVQDFEEGQERSAAERLMQRLFREHQGNLAVMAERRWLWTREGNFEEAIKLQREILKEIARQKGEEPLQEGIELGLMVQRARQLGEEGKYHRGMRLISKVLRRDNAFLDAYLALADLQLSRGSADKAIKQLQGAYEFSRSMAVLERLFEIGTEIGEATFATLRTMVSGEFHRDFVYLLLEGRYLLIIENYAEARKRFEALHAIHAPLPEVAESLAACYERDDQIPQEQVIQQLKRALELRDEFEAYYQCTECQERRQTWVAQCPTCESMNTYRSNIPGVLLACAKTAKVHA